MASTGLAGLRSALEAAVDNNLDPLLRLVCQPPLPPEDRTSEVGTEDDAYVHLSESTIAAVVESLYGIADRRKADITRTCQKHAKQIAVAHRDISSVQKAIADVRRRAQETGVGLQRQGGEHAERVESLERALLARSNIHKCRHVIQEAVEMLQVCKEAGESIEEGHVFYAYRVITALQERYEPSLHSTRNALLFGQPLSQRILEHMHIVRTEIDRNLATALTTWLTGARAAAPRIGCAAMEACQTLEQTTTILATERQDVTRLLLAENSDGKGSMEAALAIASQGLRNPKTTPCTTDPISSLCDFTLLLRCIHVHGVSGRLASFLTTYVEARRAQLGADVAPPGNLFVGQQAYLWQIVGFFIIECRVAALIHGEEGAIGGSTVLAAHIESAWEGAAAAISAEIGAVLDDVTTRPEDMFQLKRNALYACAAIDRWCGKGGGLPTEGVREALRKRKDRYRSLMVPSLFKHLHEAAVTHDAIDVSNKEMHGVVEKLFDDWKAFWEGLAPGTEALSVDWCDQTLAAAIADAAAEVAVDGDEYVSTEETGDESSDYSDYTESSEASTSTGDGGSSQPSAQSDDNADGSVLEQRYGSGTEGGGEQGGIPSGDVSLQRLLHIVGTAALAQAALMAAAHRSLHHNEVSSSVGIQLEGALIAIEDAAGRRIADSARPAFDALADYDWLPSTLPRTGGTAISPQFVHILNALQSGKAEIDAHGEGVKEESRHRVLAAALKWTGEAILQAMASKNVAALNIYAVQNLLSDLGCLNKFGAEALEGGKEPGGVPALPGRRAVTAPPGETNPLDEVVLLCECIAFNTVKDLLDPARRGEGQRYSGMNLHRAAVILEKLKDVQMLSTATVGVVARRLMRKDAVAVAKMLKELE